MIKMKVDCPYCHESFFRRDALMRHLSDYHPEISDEDKYKILKMEPCKICGSYKYSNYMKDHMCYRCFKEQSKIKCPICNKPIHKSLKQHLNRAHPEINNDEYYTILGYSKTRCIICGSEDYSEVNYKGVCPKCYDKYKIKCPECGNDILWSPARHYSKKHPEILERPNLGELKLVKCDICGKDEHYDRIVGQYVCDTCKIHNVQCPDCHNYVKSETNLYRHLVSTTTNSQYYLEEAKKNPNDPINYRILKGYEDWVKMSRRASSIISSRKRGKIFDEIYGVEKSKIIRDKISKTMMINHSGFRYHTTYTDDEKRDLLERGITTKKQRYDGFCCSKEARQRFSDRMIKNNPMHHKSAIANRENTCLQKYGVNNVMKVKRFMIKSHLHGNRFIHYSKVSKKFFDELNAKLGISDSYYGNHEWFVRNTYCEELPNIIYIDYYCKDLSLVIEFYGDYWHCNPIKYSPEDIVRNSKVEDYWKYDLTRANLINKVLKPKHFFIVWESSQSKDMEVIINAINNEKFMG